MNIDFKYTARDTPQQNYLEELIFLVLENKGRSLVYCSNVPTAIRYHIFSKAFETATLLDGLVVSDINGKKQSRYKHLFGKKQQCVNYL